jgi:hypothetical protein
MLEGPYSICHATFPSPDTDGPVLTTLSSGYKSAPEAYNTLIKVAEQSNVPASECVVIRIIELDEAPSFSG